MRSHTSPTRRPPQVRYRTIGARRDDAESIRGIARGTGLRIDATVSALVRLYELSSPEARLRAGFPLDSSGAVTTIGAAGRGSSALTPQDVDPAPDGRSDNPTSGAAA